MRTQALAAVLILAAPCAFAAPPESGKYTPAIRGVLHDGGKAVMSNVCLRQSGSEIRACGYADFDGRFYSPATRARRPAGASDESPDYSTYWLEAGRVDAPRKVGTVDLVDARTGAIELDCDLARADDQGVCRPKAARSLADHPRTTRPQARSSGDGAGPAAK